MFSINKGFTMSLSPASPRLTLAPFPLGQPDTIDDFGDKANAILALDDPNTPLQIKVATMRSDTDSAMKDSGVTRRSEAIQYGFTAFAVSLLGVAGNFFRLPSKEANVAAIALSASLSAVLGATLGFSLMRWTVDKAVKQENNKVDAALEHYLALKNGVSQ